MAIKRICVVGAGTMGRGIAQVCAQVGHFNTCIIDLTQERVDEALNLIRDNLQRHFVNKDKLTKKEAEATLSRIEGTTDLCICSGC